MALACLVLLALPTPFAWLDSAKDPSVWDPSLEWPRYAAYAAVLPKVLPTLALFGLAVADLGRGGFRSPVAALRAARAR